MRDNSQSAITTRQQRYQYQQETLELTDKLTPGTTAAQSAQWAIDQHEPLLVAMDAMLRYARAYRQHNDGGSLADDGVLGDYFKDAIQGIRGLLNGDGALAMEADVTTDSKDNGVVESLYWTACAVAGLDGDQ